VTWELALWRLIVAGIYDRKKRGCMSESDAALLEAWEKAEGAVGPVVNPERSRREPR